MSLGDLRGLALSMLAAMGGVMASASGTAAADPGVLVFPGMEIHQANERCTLGFVDTRARIAYTAGHCRGNGQVTDKDGRYIGTMATFRDNTPDGATIATDHQISDWETIALAGDVAVNDTLPGGRVLVTDPVVAAQPGQPVCHFGVVTGETCGSVAAVNNGWFTMSDGVISQKGDSGGPVYTIAPDGRAVLVGVFNSTWGRFPVAVSWGAADQQINEDIVRTASG